LGTIEQLLNRLQNTKIDSVEPRQVLEELDSLVTTLLQNLGRNALQAEEPIRTAAADMAAGLRDRFTEIRALYSAGPDQVEPLSAQVPASVSGSQEAPTLEEPQLASNEQTASSVHARDVVQQPEQQKRRHIRVAGIGLGTPEAVSLIVGIASFITPAFTALHLPVWYMLLGSLWVGVIAALVVHQARPVEVHERVRTLRFAVVFLVIGMVFAVWYDRVGAGQSRDYEFLVTEAGSKSGAALWSKPHGVQREPASGSFASGSSLVAVCQVSAESPSGRPEVWYRTPEGDWFPAAVVEPAPFSNIPERLPSCD
jgi:hypothetical protein